MTSAAKLAVQADPKIDLPYGRHSIDQADIEAVVRVLRSDRLAHGPTVAAFESAFAQSVGAADAAACSSGTAALHLALTSLDVGPGDVCIVPAITFLATATAVLMCGAEVVFADVDPATGLMTAATLRESIGRAGPAAKAVLPVHLGGRLCAMSELNEGARAAKLLIIEDACHALGGADSAGGPVGACRLSDAAAFSFHPVKTIAAGEGGMVSTPDPERANRVRRLANHGVVRERAQLRDPSLSLDEDGALNPWSYEQVELGFNYRMNELEAALGLSQLGKLERFVRRRRELAALYDLALQPFGPAIAPAHTPAGQRPALHLYQVLVDFGRLGVSRAKLMQRLSHRGIGTQVHYIPVYRHPYFVGRYGEQRLDGAETFYDRVLALPLFPGMLDQDVERVTAALADALGLD